MKITKSALRSLVREAIGADRIIRERPWSVMCSFKMSGGRASDSEGIAPDGFSVVMSGESGREMLVTVDSYWNPQAGDASGNSLKISTGGREVFSTYVPTRFDDGVTQYLIISNSPAQNAITISHAKNKNSVPIVYATVMNPFELNEDLEFSVACQNPQDEGGIGSGFVDARIVTHNNL